MCENGLTCIEGKCQICKRNINLSYDGKLVGEDRLTPGICSSNKYHKSSLRYQSEKQSSSVSTIQLSLIIFLIILYIFISAGGVEIVVISCVAIKKRVFK